MIEFEFKIINKREVDEFPKRFKAAIFPAMEKVILKAEAISKEKYFKSGNLKAKTNPKYLTVRTGHLRRSITSNVESRGSLILASLVAGTNYGSFHEFGQRPFLQPALADVVNSGFMEKIILDEIDKLAGW